MSECAQQSFESEPYSRMTYVTVRSRTGLFMSTNTIRRGHGCLMKAKYC